jgi:hypothetical protein
MPSVTNQSTVKAIVFGGWNSIGIVAAVRECLSIVAAGFIACGMPTGTLRGHGQASSIITASCHNRRIQDADA